MLVQKNTPMSHDEASHLLRRACMSAHPDRIDAVSGRLPADVVAEWLAEPVSTKLFQAPYWMTRFYPPTTATQDDVRAFLRDNEYYVEEVQALWLEDLADGSLRNRMTLFWHNHFVTDVRKYRYGALAYLYTNRFALTALGNFKAMVRNMGTDGSMLYYLDGRYNRKSAPNENYARELLELFTMGPTDVNGSPNYSQQDIAETARAFTGWVMNVRDSWTSYKVQNRFDTGEKTIFGQTGAWDEMDVVDLIFQERAPQVARYMARTLLVDMVHAEPSAEAVDAVAASWLAHDFQIAPVLKDLLSSTLFYEPDTMGAHIKSPVEFLAIELSMRMGSVQPDKAALLIDGLDGLGQTLLAPPNVAGWPGHHSWLSTESLPKRWNAAGTLSDIAASVPLWESFMMRYTDPASSHPAVSFALNLAEAVFAVPMEDVDVPEISQPFAGNLDASPLPDDLLNGPQWRIDLVKLFLGNVPWYEWSPQVPDAWVKARNYVVALAQFPEYQLS